MQLAEKDKGTKHPPPPHRTRRFLVVLGLLQVGRGFLCILFQFRLNIRGLPGRPPGIDIMVAISPLFLAIGILDILLAIPVLFQYRYALYTEFTMDIVLSFALVWFPIGALFVYDVALSYLGFGISVISIIHLVIMLWWWKPGTARQ